MSNLSELRELAAQIRERAEADDAGSAYGIAALALEMVEIIEEMGDDD